MAKFFYRAKPRQFNYKPLYYDPEKERRDKRREELLGKKVEDGDYQPGDIIRSGGMRAKARIMTDDVSYKDKQKRSQTLRLVIILALLLAIVAILYFS